MFRPTTTIGRALRTASLTPPRQPINIIRLIRPVRPSPLSSKSSKFSTQALRRRKDSGASQRASGGQQTNGNPELPKFSFDGLGMSPTMKKIVIGVVCIFGTMETYTYYRWFLTWYYGDDGEEDAIRE